MWLYTRRNKMSSPEKFPISLVIGSRGWQARRQVLLDEAQLFWQRRGGRTWPGMKRGERTRACERRRFGFVIKLRVEKAAVAIVTAERLDRQFSQEAFEKASSLGSTSALALTQWTPEPHDGLFGMIARKAESRPSPGSSISRRVSSHCSPRMSTIAHRRLPVYPVNPVEGGGT
jgi:hypothetical protein